MPLMRLVVPLILIVAGILLIAGGLGITWCFFEYESDNAGALFGMTIMPISVGLGVILAIVGIAMVIVRLLNRKQRT
jgi:uncharacterized membrane protein